MASNTTAREGLERSLIAVSPLGRPDARLIIAACRAGALGILDAGTDPGRALAAMVEVQAAHAGPWGLLVGRDAGLRPEDVPEGAVVVISDDTDPAPWRPRPVLAQVRSRAEARAALARGVEGLIAKGSESGGRIAEETSFVLLQSLMRGVESPVWVQGGIGLHSAAACVAGGARGVVLDVQLALCAESALAQAVRDVLAALDGSETVVAGGHRVLSRPGLAELPPDTASSEEVAARIGSDDPRTQLLPIGQDAAFARPLADRFGSVGAVVRAMRRSMADSIQAARRVQPLAPGSPLALAHGIRYPIFQGPMTRVSDRPAFAEAVAQAGGLPFLALALMRGDELRRLLAETRERMGARPWGAGILGFVPRELREEQIAALEQVRPPVALIAGGRPSQSRRLEQIGTVTYLHVPSPGLLDLFLADGARRFVFEGRECGGHVGPRSSFVLWEAQVARLLAFERPDELSVVFAGGIHDARSAAMVAALAAPLARRGARIGVLMGTAYLFTQEAVATGAIGETFQRQALAAEATVLLETAPGHATRCTDSSWARAFRAERSRLLAEGRDRESAWAELETQNVGRLRLASKGLRREGERLVPVDEATQERDGLFMIGQVAALRDATCTIAQLHEDVSVGATRRIAGVAAATGRSPAREAHPAHVAIVGVACIFPGAADTDEFWANVVSGADLVTEVPSDRWSADVYHDPTPGAPGRTVSKWGGFIPRVPFDPLRYGIPPRSLASIEPVQLLALEVARRALDDAGYGDRDFDRDRASVIFGAEAGTDLSAAYGFRSLYPQYLGEIPPELDAVLPRLTEDSFPGVLANVISGRIANRLDLRGVNYTVDAACAASLAALDMAVKELTTGSSDLVLCGGADLHNSINDYLMFSSVRALSPTGRCRAFDSTADGIVLAEGVACIVLKRLADAERDGDRVLAVIEGVAGSSDGRCLGLTAPRREGQVLALQRAYQRSGVSPIEVGLVEAHGTGTVVGDRTELETLDEVYREAGAESGSTAVGSLKSQLGHSKCAAGLGGLIKVALALHHRVLPPTLHLQRPNAAWNEATSPFTFSSIARPWLGSRRKAAVSAFGFGGTNFHAVLAACDGAPPPVRPFATELFVLRGASLDEALAVAECVRAAIACEPALPLRDVAFTLASGAGPVQAGIVAADRQELGARIDALVATRTASDGVLVAGGPRGPLAFLFPGQGSQRPGMLADLFIGFPSLHAKLELGARHAGAIFPPDAFSEALRERRRAALTDTRVAQPALGMVELAAAELLASLGVRPDVVGGHSYGELVALCVAGALSERELVGLSEARAESILDAAGDDPGTMAAVAAPAADVARLVEGLRGVVVANDNAPDQAVISGPTPAMAEARARLAEAGLACRPIPVACAFHSPVVAAASATFARHLAAATVARPSIPAWSNVTGEPHDPEPHAIRARLAEQVARPVRFRAQVEAMHAAGVRIFVEVGPGSVLTGLVGKILAGRPHQAIAIDQGSRGELRALLAALGRLATSGVDVDLLPLFEGTRARVVDLDASPGANPPWWVDGHRVRTPEGGVPEGGLGPAQPPLRLPPAAMSAPGGTHEAAVLEYLANLRKLAEAQRDVMLGFLGATPAPAATAPDAVAPSTATSTTPPPPPPAAAADADAEAILLDTVATMTGYPKSMLGLDLDLEAELGIDSIKRVEIVGRLASRFGLDGGADDAMVEELAACRTLRAMTNWLEARRGASGAQPADAARAPSATLRRWVLDVVDAPRPAAGRSLLPGRRFGIADDGRGVAPQLANLLASAGCATRVLAPGELPEALDALIDLRLLATVPPQEASKDLFDLAMLAVAAGARSVMGVTALGGAFGRRLGGSAPPMRGGVAGFLKSLSKERPDLQVRVVDVDPREPADRIAEHLFAELQTGDDLVEVGCAGPARHALRAVRADLAPEAGAPRALPLDATSVVLVTGGARGITALVARALFERSGCRLVLVGRTPLADEGASEDAETAAAADLASLRRVLSSRAGLHAARDVEAAARRILKEREVRENLASLRALGAEVTYRAVDVRDAAAFGAVVDDVYRDHGRLDGVVHGAGIIEDRLLRDKTRESFDRVYDTKVTAARTLLQRLRRETRFVVFFSSIAGAFGNRGQADYAAANDAMDKLALELGRRIDGRVVSINWGPWSGAGMVSPELEAEYARRGIGLIAPEQGVELLLDELARGGAESQVILACGDLPRSA